MNYAVEIKGLTKTFPGLAPGTPGFTLGPLDLTVPGGSIMGLIGENGAGKSTTIKCLLGLLQSDGGTISLLGGDPASQEVRSKIGVVMDECPFHGGLRPSQIGQVLAGVYPTWDGGLFDHYLSKFDLPVDKRVKDFSRGMGMKLSIAAALSHRPNLLILDEATSGLDPVVRNEILDEFLEFIQDEDHAILISSHITSDLERAADYITYLHKGQAVLFGEKDALLADHGRLVCTAAELAQVDPAYIVGTRRGQYTCEALIHRREEFKFRYSQLAVDPVTLEDIMVFTVKGDTK